MNQSTLSPDSLSLSQQQIQELMQNLQIEIRSATDLSRCYADSHSHLVDPRMATEDWLHLAEQMGFGLFLQGGVDPQDWQRQLAIARNHQGVRTCFGLHPYYVADHSLAEIDASLDLLSRMLSQASAVGEMGLDLRPHIAKDSFDLQVHAFTAQLELAEFAHKPMIMHLVQAFDESQRILSHWLKPTGASSTALRGLIHSFNGSAQQAQFYLDYGFGLSVGGPLLRQNNQRLKQAVAATPISHLFIESDAPDQPPPQFTGQINPPQSLFFVAQEIAKIKQLSTQAVLDICSQNLRRLL